MMDSIFSCRNMVPMMIETIKHGLIWSFYMSKRTTISDVARLAGVGVATVDRVLNGRAPVRGKTAQRVLAAAEELNYHAHGLMRRRIEEMAPVRKLGFILQKKGKWFYQSLAAEIEQAAKDLRSVRAAVEITFVESLSPTDLVEAMTDLSLRVDCLSMVAIDHPLIVAEVDRLAAAGFPVFALLSDLGTSNLSGYVGVNGRKAGRTAGWAMTHCLPSDSELGILIGSHRYLGQEDRESGFRSYIRENAPMMRLKDSIVYLDDASVAYEAASELLGANPKLKGLYHCGGGVEGVVRALNESERAQDVFYICHEESPFAVQAMTQGGVNLILASPVQVIAQQLCQAMAERLVKSQDAPARIHVPFRIVTPENI